MRPNKLREKLNANEPSIGTRMNISSPSVVEILGHTGMYDYVEFLAEYSPFHLYSLDDFCRAAELHDLGTMIKIDQEPRGFLAQRSIGAGFQSVLFADCRNVEDVEECVRVVRPDTPEDGGLYGVGARRFAYPGYGGSPEYVQALRDVVVVIMIEKKSAVDQLEEILSVEGVDMIQWGPADYSMSSGRTGQRGSDEVKAVERQVFETALKMGVPPRAEIGSPEQAKPYLDLGVRHFSLSTDFSILSGWWRSNGDALRKVIEEV